MLFFGKLSKSNAWLWISGAIFTSYMLLGACSTNPVKLKEARGHLESQGWVLIWSDEFNGAELDRTKWTAEVSCWGGGNNERQCYTDRLENISVTNGILKLKARPEILSGYEYPQDRPNRGQKITQNFTSGKIRVKSPTSWKYGRFEARLKLPHGQSTWPAFWMLPTDNRYGEWPLSGEIDIMEAINLGAVCRDCDSSEIQNRSSVALHYGGRWPENKFKTRNVKLPNAADAYHVFALEWGQGQMDWFIDNRKIYSLTHKEWHTQSADKKENPFAPFDENFNLILNLAVGGDLPDQKNEKRFNPKSFPAELLVDWVRVYQCAQDIETSRKCMILE